MRVTVEKTVNIALSEVDAMALEVILYTVMGKLVTILRAYLFIKSMQVSWRGYLMHKV